MSEKETKRRERLRTFLDRIPAGLSDESKKIVVKAYVIDKVDYTTALAEAVAIGEKQAIEEMRKEVE